MNNKNISNAKGNTSRKNIPSRSNDLALNSFRNNVLLNESLTPYNAGEQFMDGQRHIARLLLLNGIDSALLQHITQWPNNEIAILEDDVKHLIGPN